MQISARTIPPEAADNPKIWKAAQDFEAMTLGALLAPMFETVDMSKNSFGGGAGEAAFQPMLVQEMAKGLAHQGGLGLANSIFTQLLRTQEQAAGKDERTPDPAADLAAPAHEPTLQRGLQPLLQPRLTSGNSRS